MKKVLKSNKRFLTRKFSKFPIYTYKGNCHALWRPCFLTDKNSLKELHRGPPKEHFCKISFKIKKLFFIRRFFKFPIQSNFGNSSTLFSRSELDFPGVLESSTFYICTCKIYIQVDCIIANV